MDILISVLRVMVVFVVKLFLGLILRVPFMRPSEDNWPPGKIAAYADAAAIPDPAAKIRHYRMRSAHKKFDKTIYVWRACSWLTLRSTPFFVLRRILAALLRAAVLAALSVYGLKLFLWPLGTINAGLGASLQEESAILANIHAYLMSGVGVDKANNAVMAVYLLIGRYLNIKDGDSLFHMVYQFGLAYGLIVLWAAALAIMLGLAINAVKWLALAVWTLIPFCVEDHWLDAMERKEWQHGTDLAALTGGEGEAKPAGPTPPHYDENGPAPFRRQSRGGCLVVGAVVVAAVGGAVWRFGWPELPALPSLPVATAPERPLAAALPLADRLRQAVPDGFRDPSHWMRDDRAGCLVYHPQEIEAGESVTWSGACADGFAEGRGVAVWRQNGKEGQRDEATLDHGVRDGVAILRFPSGTAYRDRYDHGRRVERQKIAP